ALSCVRGRILEMEIDGKKVFVKVDNGFMNLGANEQAAGKGTGGRLPHNYLERQINTIGYVQFVKDVHEFVEGQLGSDLSRQVGIDLNALVGKENKILLKNKVIIDNLNKKYKSLDDLYNKELKDRRKIEKLQEEIKGLEKIIGNSYEEML